MTTYYSNYRTHMVSDIKYQADDPDGLSSLFESWRHFRAVDNFDVEWPEGIRTHREHGSMSNHRIGYAFTAHINQYVIKAEGLSEISSEIAAWEKYQDMKDRMCQFDHYDPKNAEKKGYKNGCGFCLHCEMFLTHIFPIDHRCHRCNKRANWTSDKEGNHWCVNCTQYLMPEDRQGKQ